MFATVVGFIIRRANIWLCALYDPVHMKPGKAYSNIYYVSL